MNPEHYPRRILLAVTGLSPQVLTETLYALTQVQQPAFIPTEVHLITTQQGAEYARLTLLDNPHLGRFHQLLADFRLPAMEFGPQQIHVICDQNGQALSDIRTPSENASAADCITALVRQLTSDDNAALHVSIAGGRKTMGFYLGYALSLFGREQDRLSHVLVSDPFESNHEFYYPPPQPQVLFTRENKPISTADAKLELASIPFVRMRDSISPTLVSGADSFGAIVTATQRSLAPPKLTIYRDRNRIECGGITVEMPPIQYAFYRWLAERSLRLGAPQSFVRYTDPVHAEFLEIYRQTVTSMADDYEQLKAQLEQDGFSKEFFEQKKSKANSLLKTALRLDADRYLIVGDGKRPQTRFGIDLPADCIRLA